jgi:hypothetical protein
VVEVYCKGKLNLMSDIRKWSKNNINAVQTSYGHTTLKMVDSTNIVHSSDAKFLHYAAHNKITWSHDCRYAAHYAITAMRRTMQLPLRGTLYYWPSWGHIKRGSYCYTGSYHFRKSANIFDQIEINLWNTSNTTNKDRNWLIESAPVRDHPAVLRVRRLRRPASLPRDAQKRTQGFFHTFSSYVNTYVPMYMHIYIHCRCKRQSYDFYIYNYVQRQRCSRLERI